MSTTIAIALGGNLGNVPETFDRALHSLTDHPGIQLIRRSRNFRTRAIGSQAGDDYINAAALLQVHCTPQVLLNGLQQIEADCGRTRTLHWGPRTLDLDLLRFGDVQMVEHGPGREQNGNRGETDRPNPQQTESGSLIVPHPACWYRRFVLDPWYEIDPEWNHPLLRETVREMRGRLVSRPIRVLITGPLARTNQLSAGLQRTFSSREIGIVPASSPREIEFHVDEENPLENPPPRSVFLDGPDMRETATQILRAMLDVPQPIGGVEARN